jgi:hypothetical protein
MANATRFQRLFIFLPAFAKSVMFLRRRCGQTYRGIYRTATGDLAALAFSADPGFVSKISGELDDAYPGGRPSTADILSCQKKIAQSTAMRAAVRSVTARSAGKS